MLILTTLMFERNFASVVFEWGYLQGQTHAHIRVLTGSGLLVTCWHSVQPIMLYNAHFMYTRLWPYSSKYPSDFVPRAFMFSENNKSSLLWHYSFNFKVWWVNVVLFSLLRHNELVRHGSNYFYSGLNITLIQQQADWGPKYKSRAHTGSDPTSQNGRWLWPLLPQPTGSDSYSVTTPPHREATALRHVELLHQPSDPTATWMQASPTQPPFQHDFPELLEATKLLKYNSL